MEKRIIRDKWKIVKRANTNLIGVPGREEGDKEP